MLEIFLDFWGIRIPQKSQFFNFRSSASLAQRMASMTTPAELGETHTSSLASRFSD